MQEVRKEQSLVSPNKSLNVSNYERTDRRVHWLCWPSERFLRSWNDDGKMHSCGENVQGAGKSRESVIWGGTLVVIDSPSG